MASSCSTPMEQEEQPPTTTLAAAPKHRRALSAMLATLFVSEVRSASKNKKPADAGPGFLAKFLCGLHPLHHAQFNEEEEEDVGRRMPMPARTKSESFHDVLLPPPSPEHVTMTTVVEEGMTSRYASAEDLQALDNSEEEGEERGSNVNSAIDMQAEEFIAKFYAQMRLQRSDSVEQS